MTEPVSSTWYPLKSTWFIAGFLVHLLFLGSLLSEPWILEHGVNLSGSRSHPQEVPEFKGYMDPLFHDTDRVPRGLDFFSIYQSGHNFLNGTSVYYGVRVHSQGDNALVVPYFSGFRYLPVYAYTYGVLLNIFPPWISYWTWILCIELLLGLNLYIVLKLNIERHLKSFLLFAWLAYSPFYIEIHIGQQSMVTVTLIHLVVLAYNKGCNWQRDLSYIGSVIWKINTILFIPIWVKFKRYYSILALILLTIGLSLPYFILVEGSFPEFTSYFKHKFIAVGPNSLGFWALAAATMQRLGLNHDLIKQILSLWTLLMLTFCSLMTLVPRRIKFQNLLAMWLCTYFLTYQYVWEHHYVMMLPVFSLLIDNHRLRKWMIPVWFFCAIPTPYLLLNSSSMAMPQLNWSFLQMVIYHSVKVIPVFILFVRIAVEEIRSPEKSTEPQHDFIQILFRHQESHETEVLQHSTNLPEEF